MHVAVAYFILTVFLSGYLSPLISFREPPDGELLIEPGGGVQEYYMVKPSSEIDNARVVKQNYDYSCGSAALTTLLNYHLGEELSEQQVMRGMLEYGDRERITTRRAFSFLDMKKFVNVLGYKGVGYKAEIDDLRTLGRPCVLPMDILNYRHFVVFRGIYDDHVFVADPWRGNISFTLPDFMDKWHEQVLLIVYPEGATELNALRLRDEDLRYIDEDAVLDILFDHEPIISRPEELQMELLPSRDQYYDRQ